MIYSENDFRCDPYKDSRGSAGESGNLLLGELNGKQYLIKHTIASDVTNEFVAHKLALSLGVPTTDAILIKKKKRSSRFVENYAVGIEVAEGFQRANLDHFVGQDDSPYINDLMRYMAFRRMICLEDNVQLAYSNGRLISFDYAESFNNGEFSYKIMILSGDGRNAVTSYLNGISSLTSAYKSTIAIMKLNDTKVKCDAFYYPIYKFHEEKNKIQDTVLPDLIEAFPNVITSFYYSCFCYLDGVIEKIIKTKGAQN